MSDTRQLRTLIVALIAELGDEGIPPIDGSHSCCYPNFCNDRRWGRTEKSKNPPKAKSEGAVSKTIKDLFPGRSK